jgi:hypothetical protein
MVYLDHLPNICQRKELMGPTWVGQFMAALRVASS